MQIRAGRCPNCDEEVAPEARVCPNCGHTLAWNNAGATAAGAASTQASVAPRATGVPALQFLVWLVIACAAILAAVTIRTKFFNRSDAPNLSSEHGTSVQDAETFRDQIKTNGSNADAPETAYVIGMAMPNGKDVLEITVKNEWKTLDYPTRLNYAAKFVEHWKDIHAPHRAGISILDESGNEIGGRTWNGTVWVVEKDNTPAPKSKTKTPAAKTSDASTPASTPTPPDATNNSVGNATTNSASTPAPSDSSDVKDIENQ